MQVLSNFTIKLEQKAKTLMTAVKRLMWRVTLIGVVLTAVAVGAVVKAYTVSVPHVHNIYSAAKLIDGEARGESRKGQKAVFASILTRMADDRFPDTFHAVMYQPYSNNVKLLQYNAMGDHWHEDLSTDLGQTILMRTTWWYLQNELGIFRAPAEARGAHSYCVPAACERQKGYFGRLYLIGTIGNHDFYGDEPQKLITTIVSTKNTAITSSLRPKARPTTGSSLAPTKSLRPQARPQSASAAEQWQKQIDAVVAAAVLKI